MKSLSNLSLLAALGSLALLLAPPAGCAQNEDYAKVYPMTSMAQAIGGPAAAGRPGDYILENELLRAVIHGRHNMRSTFPIGNGNLIDLDLQRPHHKFGVGKGKDAFYEIGPMVNLKISSASEITYGACGEVGGSPCPERPCEELGSCGSGGGKALDARCVRVSAKGVGDNILGILGLLDLAIKKKYPAKSLEIVTDYDLCPGERFIRMTTRARFYGPSGEHIDIPELPGKTSLFEVMLGQHSGIDCARQSCPPEAPICDDLLISLSLGSLNTEMKRCRKDTDRAAGVLAGDLTFFSAKAGIFVPGSGFDHETFIRSIFDTGGDVFSNPLALDYVSAVADDVSYAYFNASGQMMIPLFSESFTASMSNAYGCSPADPECFKDKELVFRRYVAVGDGSVASALEPFYKLRGIPTGRVVGHVIDQRTRRPVSGAQVFVVKLPAAWAKLSDAQVALRSYEELVEAARSGSRSADNPLGEVGIISHFRTDTGLDTVHDGSFAGVLPAERLVLVTRDKSSFASPLAPVTVTPGQTVHATLVMPAAGRLAFAVRDAGGRPIPSKLTIGACMPECARDADCKARAGRPTCDTERSICVAEGGAKDAKSCRPDQTWDDKTSSCQCPTKGRLPLELGGKRYADGTMRTVLRRDGRGEVSLPPGTYEVIASRGIEYSIARKFVTIQADVTSHFQAALSRVVDTKGWISADFHVHGPNSVDSGLDHDTRVTSFVAEGVELLSSSDHDNLTDYGPTIVRLGVQPWISSQVGVEVSPLDYGHYLGFPLRFNENIELNGAFHWRKDFPGGSPDWQNRAPGEIFSLLREAGELDQTMVVIAHFYDSFTFYDLDMVTLEAPALSVTAFFNPVLQGGKFSGAFDGLEALSGKNFDIIRRPTFKEIRDYNVGLTAILARKDLTYEQIQTQWARLSANVQRELLRRTPEEQTTGLRYSNPDFECRCTADSECGAKSLCDERTGACIPSCDAATDCAAVYVTGKREDCLPKPPGGDSARRTCQRLAKTCTTDAECDLTWGTDAKESCQDAPGGGKTCVLSCVKDSECVDPLRPSCDLTRKVCIEKSIVSATDISPCVTVRGTLDDWFQLLNRGVRRTVFGNSDTHDVYGIEAGMPRNYVRSSTDQPSAIDRREIAEGLKKLRSFATFGPFLEVLVDGQPVGSTVKPGAGGKVQLAIRVQSPLWFDVDRIEVYKNGELLKVITGREDCPPQSADCLKVPNDQVLNFDAVIEDTPTEDSWYVVLAMGLDGKSMAPVYSSTPVARLGIFELVQRLTPLLPPLRSLRTPLSPTISVVRPFAVANPVFVDVDGDGVIKAKDPLPSWATKADKEAQQSASASGGLRPTPTPKVARAAAASTPTHDHRVGLGKMRQTAKAFLDAIKAGQIDRQAIQKSFSSLRYAGHRH